MPKRKASAKVGIDRGEEPTAWGLSDYRIVYVPARRAWIARGTWVDVLGVQEVAHKVVGQGGTMDAAVKEFRRASTELMAGDTVGLAT